MFSTNALMDYDVLPTKVTAVHELYSGTIGDLRIR